MWRMKDSPQILFGVTIAYLVPGAFAIVTLGLWFETVRPFLLTFTTVNANVGLFFLVVLFALLSGLILSPLRWALFERLLLQKKMIKPFELRRLVDPNRSAAFFVIVEQHYRYHQCWGAIVLVAPFFFWGVGRLSRPVGFELIVFMGGSLLVSSVTAWAAYDALEKYCARTRAVLEESDGEWNRIKENDQISKQADIEESRIKDAKQEEIGS